MVVNILVADILVRINGQPVNSSRSSDEDALAHRSKPAKTLKTLKDTIVESRFDTVQCDLTLNVM